MRPHIIPDEHLKTFRRQKKSGKTRFHETLEGYHLQSERLAWGEHDLAPWNICDRDGRHPFVTALHTYKERLLRFSKPVKERSEWYKKFYPDITQNEYAASERESTAADLAIDKITLSAGLKLTNFAGMTEEQLDGLRDGLPEDEKEREWLTDKLEEKGVRFDGFKYRGVTCNMAMWAAHRHKSVKEIKWWAGRLKDIEPTTKAGPGVLSSIIEGWAGLVENDGLPKVLSLVEDVVTMGANINRDCWPSKKILKYDGNPDDHPKTLLGRAQLLESSSLLALLRQLPKISEEAKLDSFLVVLRDAKNVKQSRSEMSAYIEKLKLALPEATSAPELWKEKSDGIIERYATEIAVRFAPSLYPFAGEFTDRIATLGVTLEGAYKNLSSKYEYILKSALHFERAPEINELLMQGCEKGDNFAKLCTGDLWFGQTIIKLADTLLFEKSKMYNHEKILIVLAEFVKQNPSEKLAWMEQAELQKNIFSQISENGIGWPNLQCLLLILEKAGFKADSSALLDISKRWLDGHRGVGDSSSICQALGDWAMERAEMTDPRFFAVPRFTPKNTQGQIDGSLGYGDVCDWSMDEGLTVHLAMATKIAGRLKNINEVNNGDGSALKWACMFDYGDTKDAEHQRSLIRMLLELGANPAQEKHESGEWWTENLVASNPYWTEKIAFEERAMNRNVEHGPDKRRRRI
jgi:hypothetical protein